MHNLTDWAAQSCRFGGLCNPKDQGEARRAAKQFDQVRDAFIDRMRGPVKDVLDEVISEVQSAARSARTRSELRTLVEAAAEGGRPLYRDEVEGIFQDVSTSFYRRTHDALDGTERSHAWYLKQPQGQGRQPSEGQPAQGPTPGAGVAAAAAAFFAANLGVLVAGAHLTTRRAILNILEDVIQEAREEGLRLDEVVDLFLDRLGLSNLNSQARAGLIARTLVIRASNWASLRAARDHPQDWLKNWVSVRDNRVRPAHLDTDFSDPIPLGEQFNVGGFPARFPADPRLPPGQSINCRCVLFYISE